MIAQQPIAYGYVRCSHIIQVDKESIPQQKESIEKYYERHLKDTHSWGGHVEDAAVSAFHSYLQERPGGKALLAKCLPGDMIVFDKIDRVWRRSADFALSLEFFQNQSISWRIVDFLGTTMDCDSPMFNLMLTMWVALGQFESEILSGRIKRALEDRRRQGRCFGSKPPMGCKFTKVDGVKVIEWDKDIRTIMGEIVRLRQTTELTWDQISWEIERRLAKAHNRPFPEKFTEFYKRVWYTDRCRRFYRRELEYRQAAESDSKWKDNVPLHLIHVDDAERMRRRRNATMKRRLARAQ